MADNKFANHFATKQSEAYCSIAQKMAVKACGDQARCVSSSSRRLKSKLEKFIGETKFALHCVLFDFPSARGLKWLLRERA